MSDKEVALVAALERVAHAIDAAVQETRSPSLGGVPHGRRLIKMLLKTQHHITASIEALEAATGPPDDAARRAAASDMDARNYGVHSTGRVD